MEKEGNELEALNELLIINNDRVEGYMKAATLTKEHELKSLFHNMADESRTIARELATEMVKFDGLPSEGCTTHAGKIYRLWMDIRVTINSKKSDVILSSCEFGEKAVQSVYKTVLESNDLTGDSHQMIARQKEKLKDSLELIKQYRSSAVVA